MMTSMRKLDSNYDFFLKLLQWTYIIYVVYLKRNLNVIMINGKPELIAVNRQSHPNKCNENQCGCCLQLRQKAVSLRPAFCVNDEHREGLETQQGPVASWDYQRDEKGAISSFWNSLWLEGSQSQPLQEEPKWVHEGAANKMSLVSAVIVKVNRVAVWKTTSHLRTDSSRPQVTALSDASEGEECGSSDVHLLGAREENLLP